MTVSGRFSYLHVDAPWAGQAGNRKRWGGDLLIPKDTPEGKADFKKLKARIDELKAQNPDSKIKSTDLFLKDGDSEDCRNAAAKGHWIVSAYRAEKQTGPQIFTRKKVQIENTATGHAEYPYSGAYGRMVITPFFTKNGGIPRITASIEIIQKTADGERLGGSSDASPDDLPDLPDDESDGLDADDDGLGDLD